MLFLALPGLLVVSVRADLTANLINCIETGGELDKCTERSDFNA